MQMMSKVIKFIYLLEPLPFERIDRVLPITGTTHLGFDKAHTILSSTK